MNLKHTLATIFCFLVIGLGAQDLQYSYYQFSPISYNPAFTGAFFGNLRANVLIRDQWRTVSTPSNEFQTLSLAFDGNIPFGLTEGDWISAGINIAKDEVGVSNFKHSYSGLSLAYHLAMGKKQTSVLTLGLKYGKYSKGPLKMNDNYLSTRKIADPLGPHQDLNGLGNKGGQMDTHLLGSANDFMLGLLLSAPIGNSSDIRIGLAMDHLLGPTLQGGSATSNSTTAGEKLDRRINFNIQFYTDLNDKLTFNPTILYQKMGQASNILVQGLFSYLFSAEKEIYLNAGTGIRLSDNSFIPLYFGADIKSWRFGLSYSLNVGGLAAVSREGGFELGISKIFSWNKKVNVKPKFVCPRL